MPRRCEPIGLKALQEWPHISAKDPWSSVSLQKEVKKTMQKARQQVEYYFSEGNLADDAYLRSLMDSDGWVSLEKIMTFPRMKKHKLVIHEVAQVLRDSDSAWSSV
eukprot:symbB.v1.2.000754.t1/scaffold36.1/size400579/26